MKRKSKRLRNIERAVATYPGDYFQAWVAFVACNCAQCQYGEFVNQRFPNGNEHSYPKRCLYWDKDIKPIIRMYVRLQCDCGHKLLSPQKQIIVPIESGYKVML
jgi:hypothetical protein